MVPAAKLLWLDRVSIANVSEKRKEREERRERGGILNDSVLMPRWPLPQWILIYLVRDGGSRTLSR